MMGGTPSLSEEDREEMLKEQQRLQGLITPPDETQIDPQAQTPEATAEAVPEPQAPVTEQVTPNRYRDAQGNVDIEKLRREGAEFDMAAATGVLDFGVDLLNLIPNVDIPKVSPYENEVAQSVRELSSILIPTVALGGVAGAAVKGSKAVQASKFLNDPLVKHIGQTALSAGTGAFVDYTVEINQEDDNLSGSLRKQWPRWFGWIPEDVATLDSDSPEIKRAKNVTEGAYLGVGTDLLLGLNKLFKGVRGIDRATQWVPESEKATAWFSKNLEIDATPEAVIERSAGKRSDALDEIGSYNLDKSTNLDQPIFGVHDLYGYQEQGVRSADDLGVIGASVDVVRINKDIETVYGRVGSVVTEGALKFGLETADNQEMVIRGIASQLQDAGEYGYNTAGGRYISHKEVVEEGEALAAQFYDMDLPQLKRAISKLQRPDPDTNVMVLRSEGYAGVMGAIKKYMDDFVNMDYMRAQAYVGTSMAGQVSDMAQGMRLTEGTPAIERAQEQILDRVEFLMAQKGMTSYARGRALNMLNLWNRMTVKGTKAFDMAEAKRLEGLIKNEGNATLRTMERIKQEAKSTVDNLRVIKEEQPEMLAPLMMAYELTDGNVKTIARLNDYIRNSTGVLSKAFIDLNPEIPSVVLRGFFSNLYNSTLSAFATPIKAGLSNAYLLAEKPVRTMAGGLMNGDLKTIRRGWYQYNAALETLQDSFGYMKEVFKRSGTDPYVVAARDDIGLRNEAQMDVLRAFANAKAAEGEYGPQVMLQIVEDMNALADHPWLRFGNRSMQALDGFTQSMIATAEAKGRAYDMVTNGGKEAFDADKAQALYTKVRDGMFDKNTGLITDDAVKHTTGEIALNLDNAANDAFSSAIRRFPVLKPFLLFTKTPLNDLALSATYTPLGVFSKTRKQFSLPFEEMAGEEVERLLVSRGVDLENTPSIKAKYDEIRADIKGREAIGNLAVAGAVGLFLNDRITGNGLYDKQKQALRREINWKPRSIRLPGGEWVSYDNLGPITNWLALTVDVMDNFGSLAPNDIGEQLHKLGFVMASSITEKTSTSGLEAFFDVLRGDTGTINKWTASFLTSATVPGSSQLAEISRLMDPGLKEVEMSVFDLMRNRNPMTKGQLPAVYDWIDGGEVGIPDTFMARVWNTYMPWKVSGSMSDEKQFLMDIEYDARPTLRTNGKGIEYTKDERSEITNIMGRDGLFKDGIKRVMQTTQGREFRRRYKEAVDAGLEPDLSIFEDLHIMLDRELRYAMKMASAKSSSRDSVSRKMYIQETVGGYLRSGMKNEAERFLQYMGEYSY